MRVTTILFITLLISIQAFAQKKHTISGYVKDAKSGELLIGATIYVPKLRTGASANSYGFYSITLPADSQIVIYSFIGFKPQIKKLLLTEDIRLNVNLESVDYNMKEAVVSTNKAKENVERPVMGVIDIPIQQVKELPVIMGEKDIFKILQLLPGVQSGSEASAGFYVRGGGPDQNLILLDEAVIYNPFHLAGFFSTFNADAIKSVTLTKGGFPAQHGGRLSSIIDISMKDGNDKQLHGEGGIGAISSRFTLEGPLIKNRSSFMISGRRTYLDQIIRPFLPKKTDIAYYFYDLNAKLNYRFSDKDRIYVSGYMGRDVAFAQEVERFDTTRFQTDWGNKSFTARWNHLYGPKLFSNTTFLFSDYVFNIGTRMGGISALVQSGIRDLGGKVDFDYFPDIRHRIKFGGNYAYQLFTPSMAQLKSSTGTITDKQVKFVHQGGIYAQDEFTWTEKLSVNVGLRVPFFVYKETKYINVEPRLTGKYSLDQRTSIKGGYTWMNQFVHMLTNSTIASPLDLWIPSSNVVKPQRSQQVAAGIFRNWLKDTYESSIEVYYKNMHNLIEYKQGAVLFQNKDVEKELVFGKGWSYGAEFFIRKNQGRITGFAGYTLSWTNRQFNEINGGKTYPAKYDRRHDFAITGVYQFNDNWSFSAVFVYGSGHALTVPFGSYTSPMLVNGGFANVFDYVEKNFYKLKAFNRLDVGIKYTKKKEGRWQNDWRFDLYNVYSRRNPYFVYLTESYDPHSNAYKPTAKQISLFPLVPSVSYNFRF